MMRRRKRQMFTVLALVAASAVLYVLQAAVVERSGGTSPSVSQRSGDTSSDGDGQSQRRARTAGNARLRAETECADRLVRRLVSRTIVVGCFGGQADGLAARFGAVLQEAGVFVGGNDTAPWSQLEAIAGGVPRTAEGSLAKYMWQNMLGTPVQHAELVEEVRALLERGLYRPLRAGVRAAAARQGLEALAECSGGDLAGLESRAAGWSPYRAVALPVCRSTLLLPLLERAPALLHLLSAHRAPRRPEAAKREAVSVVPQPAWQQRLRSAVRNDCAPVRPRVARLSFSILVLVLVSEGRFLTLGLLPAPCMV